MIGQSTQCSVAMTLDEHKTVLNHIGPSSLVSESETYGKREVMSQKFKYCLSNTKKVQHGVYYDKDTFV